MVIRLLLAAIFLGSCDTINSIAGFPLAATHSFLFIPYLPIVTSILGSSASLVAPLHFLPIGMLSKLVPCLADGLLSVWFLLDGRYDPRHRLRAAWIYAFCPLPLIIICIQGQWESLWVLPMVTAVAMADLAMKLNSPRTRSLMLIGALVGVAILSKPVAVIVVGLLLPSLRHRSSLMNWTRDAGLMLLGATVTVGLFFYGFASAGINVRRNILGAFEYAGAPGSTVFGPANLSIFHGLNTLSNSAALDFRQLSIVYVAAIVIYQLVAETPADRMSAAAAALLICPAVGGLAPQYLLWPLVFIMAAGRMRIAIAYAFTTSLICFAYFLIPAASYSPGQNIGAYLPLRSLGFMGIPRSALAWFATSPVALDVWRPLADLVLPAGMCVLGIYLLVVRHTPVMPLGEPPSVSSDFRAWKTCPPFVTVLLLATVVYGIQPIKTRAALITSVSNGINHYAFTRSIFSWRQWSSTFFWSSSTPWRDVVSGSWWGTVLILGPVLIFAWGYFAFLSQRSVANAASEVQVCNSQ